MNQAIDRVLFGLLFGLGWQLSALVFEALRRLF